MRKRTSGFKLFMYNFFIFFFSAVFIISLSIYVMLGPIESARRTNEKQELLNQFSFDFDRFESSYSQSDTDEDAEPEPYIPSFHSLLSENEEIRAWLTIPGTNVDYPIVQAKDNDYYLTHNYKGEKASGGAIFFDYTNRLDNTDKILVAYGHNMRDKSMFATIKQYKSEEFYRQNRYIYLDTDFAPEKYEVYSVFAQNVDPNFGTVFKYNKTSFETDGDFLQHVVKLREKSIFHTVAPEATASSKFIVLQTCTNGTGIYNNDRFVVVGIKVN